MSSSAVHQWRHVPTQHNPADISSRGTLPSNLIENNLWWSGPEWLVLSSSHWPESKVNPSPPEIDEPELRKKYVNHNVTIVSSDIITRFSSLTNLRRIVALCLRFKFNCQQKQSQHRIITPITAEELEQSLLTIIKVIQTECFSPEIHHLKSNGTLSHQKSRLIALTPKIENSILRVGGRLQNANLTYDEKHPFIIPDKHHFTELLVRETYRELLHAGTQLTMSHLRRRYWILNGRNIVRHTINRCVTCCKNNPKPSTQLMGNLPSARIIEAPPFATTGVDYAGPIDIRVSKGRGQKSYKGYIAVFVCLVTKAIHLEAVSDLTTAAFIAALKRFIGRRGLCNSIYSDCGTNFIGADNELRRNFNQNRQLIERDVMPFLANRGIQWHFIPPASPHFGGLWEAGVKSTKYHLRRILNNTTLTYEEMSTLLCQIESCLNSRPLAPNTNDPHDLTALTPGHFLIQRSMHAAPEKPSDNLSEHIRWQHLQILVDHFWQRWSQEYFQRLQSRPKWAQQQVNYQPNELVLIRDERLPPNQWLMGRIVAVHPGKDDIVRVVTLKTKNGLLKRPIVKICRLPIITAPDTSKT